MTYRIPATASRSDHPWAVEPASRQSGTYPRPQMLRQYWTSLDGAWAFRHDDQDRGGRESWSTGFPSGREITVPFPPESAASGVQEPGFHPVVWYARTIRRDDVIGAGASSGSSRLLLHFGAVDYRAQIWVDGEFLGEHEGGHTPFTFDVTDVLRQGDEHLLVVRAEDDPHDLTQPRGKQDWHENAHAIWYRRTTGIWQTVWLEAVPEASIAHLLWAPGDPSSIELTVRIRGRTTDARVRVTLWFEERNELLAAIDADIPPNAREVHLTIPIARQRNGQAEDELTWSPEHPRLIDATVSLLDASGEPTDAVASYIGMRTVAVGRGAFWLNGRPYQVRSVLSQGFWPTSHLAAPSVEAYRREVELIKELGFTACRIHQKIEDPRFLFWADRLGLLVWGEAPNAYEFSATAIRRLTTEWLAAIDRDFSHPSIVTWVPFNESWGIQHVRDNPSHQAYARALVDMTRALDPRRPVVCNDGWEQQATDIITVHDYEGDGTLLAASYADDAARSRLLAAIAPSGHTQLVGSATDAGQPVMLTEFGGVDYQPGMHREDGWGYTVAADEGDWILRISALYDAVRASSFLAGSCYTQLTDTMQETNGLADADRQPKAPIQTIRRAVTGG